MSATRIVLTEQDRETVRAALPAVRRTSPEAAAIIGRLLRATAEPAGPGTAAFASVREVAAAFAVTEQTVRNWVDRGWLPGSRRVGRGPRRIPRSVLASAEALAQPRPPAPDLRPAEVDAILSSPRRRVAK